MKRMHMHVCVDDIARSVGFYSTMFGTAPTVLKADYAKWMLDDPRVNFAISTHGSATGLDHIGIQAESGDELREIADRLKEADLQTLDQDKTQCCYAVSDKSWVSDPAGLRWETFHTVGDATSYGESAPRPGTQDQAQACCSRAAPQAACC